MDYKEKLDNGLTVVNMVGYVGVYEKVQTRIDEEWKFFAEVSDEDTSENT